MISVSSSNWLDRLRSSRGFPTGDKPDLDRFLTTSSSGSVPTSESTQSPSTIPTGRISVASDQKNDKIFPGEVSNILCDLFNMGESSRKISTKKNCRKQINPRFCGVNGKELCSSDDLRRHKSENNRSLLDSSGDNSLNERKFIDEEKGDFDMKGFSKNEIMVMDTSLDDWKFDGWVFRKKDEWRIKEKKNKSRVIFGGKKKMNKKNLNQMKKIKMKMKKKKKSLLVNSLNNETLKKDQMMKTRNKDNGLSLLPQNHGLSQNDPKEGPINVGAESLSKVSSKRFPCPRPQEKPGNGVSTVSPVILLKSIPLNDSYVATKPGKSSHKKKQPKKMKII